MKLGKSKLMERNFCFGSGDYCGKTTYILAAKNSATTTIFTITIKDEA
jgi:hypothetical protein